MCCPLAVEKEFNEQFKVSDSKKNKQINKVSDSNKADHHSFNKEVTCWLKSILCTGS